MKTAEQLRERGARLMADLKAKRVAKPNGIISGLENVTHQAQKVPAPDLQHQRAIGAVGGLSRSEAKTRASRANAERARVARAYLHPSPLTTAERARAYRLRQKALGQPLASPEILRSILDTDPPESLWERIRTSLDSAT